MDYYSPNLQKQRSLSSINLSSEYEKLYPSKRSLTLGRLIQWKGLWRRILRKKKRIFDSSSSSATASNASSYDLEAYAQNFDEGAAAEEPENLSRSFSVRFAAAPELLRRVD